MDSPARKRNCSLTEDFTIFISKPKKSDNRKIYK